MCDFVSFLSPWMDQLSFRYQMVYAIYGDHNPYSILHIPYSMLYAIYDLEGSNDVNLNKFQGLVTLVGTSAVEANNATYYGGTATAITTANVVAIFDALYKAIPATVVAKDDMTIWCGQDVFRTYTIALKNANMFNYAFDGKADSEFFLPGTPIKVVATPGLNGVNKIYAIRLSNMFLGTDLLNEEERFELFYAKEADQVRFVSEFKMGVNVAFLDEIASFII